MQLVVFLVLRGWLGYVIRTLISGKCTCEIFKELDREISNKRRFKENFVLGCLSSQKYIKRSCPVYFKQQM